MDNECRHKNFREFYDDGDTEKVCNECGTVFSAIDSDYHYYDFDDGEYKARG